MRAGTLRHRVRIDAKRQSAPDPLTGDIVEGWEALYADVPAEIAPVSAREFIASQTVKSQATARVTMRPLPGVDFSCRIVGLSAPYVGRIFNIAGILEDKVSGQQHVTFPVTEGVNDG